MDKETNMRVIIQDANGNEVFQYTLPEGYYYEAQGKALGIAILAESLWRLQTPCHDELHPQDYSNVRFINYESPELPSPP